MTNTNKTEKLSKGLRAAYLRGNANASRGFAGWLDRFLDEKGIDGEEQLDVEGPSGLNVIPVGCLVEAMKAAPKHEQEGIKAMIVRLDFANAPIRPYLLHLARAIAL